MLLPRFYQMHLERSSIFQTMHYTDSSALAAELQLLVAISNLNIKSHNGKNNVIQLF